VASFAILTEPVPYTFVSVNRRNNEARAYIAMENSPRNIRGYTGIFIVYVELSRAADDEDMRT